MEQKIVTFNVAKAIKDAGYPQFETNYHWGRIWNYADKIYRWSLTEVPYMWEPTDGDREYFLDAPTYLDVWLWLCKIKGFKFKVYYNGIHDCWFCEWSYYSQRGADTEEAIVAVIDYLVDNDMIK